MGAASTEQSNSRSTFIFLIQYNSLYVIIIM